MACWNVYREHNNFKSISGVPNENAKNIILFPNCLVSLLLEKHSKMKPITNALSKSAIDSQKAVNDYLDNNGFYFEQEVADEFAENGMSTIPQQKFKDPLTGKVRDIDVLASVKHIGAPFSFKVVFVIACKVAPAPWILLPNSNGGEITKFGYPHNWLGERWLKYLNRQPGFQGLFDSVINPGYSLASVTLRVREEGEFSSPNKAINSITNFLSYELKEGTQSERNCHVMYVPVIAIKGCLFKSKSYKALDEVNEEIDQAQYFHSERIGTSYLKIHIVTNHGLSTFVKHSIARIKEDLFYGKFSNHGLDKRPIFDPPTFVRMRNRNLG